MSSLRTAALILEDGSVYTGRSIGADREVFGETVFHTAFCGYQEILTDPSYRGQIVCMAFPAIGNYGITDDFAESGRIQAEAVVVADSAGLISGCGTALEEYLASQGVPGIDGVDTRALVRHVRSYGAMRAMLTSRFDENEHQDLVARVRASPLMAGRDLVSVFEAEERIFNRGGAPLIGLLDCGAKSGIARSLVELGCRVETCSTEAGAAAITRRRFGGIVLSNGPGDPAALDQPVATVRELLGKVPVFGICLGHQILARAVGGRTYKLPFGHRGSNHPVIEHSSGRIRITSQNHGFAVDPASLPKGVLATETNLYDGTNEGISIPEARAFSVQYHPEARPGPHDASDHFERFLSWIPR